MRMLILFFLGDHDQSHDVGMKCDDGSYGKQSKAKMYNNIHRKNTNKLIESLEV